MKWKMVSKNLVAHENGHSIELKAGSWRSPMDIHPKILRGTSNVETAQLIREGLEYAYKAAMPAASPIRDPREKTSAS